MVSVKYNNDNDGVTLAQMALEDDLIERNLFSRFRSILLQRNFKGAILHNLDSLDLTLL